MRVVDVLKLEMRNHNEPLKEEFAQFEEDVIRHNLHLSGMDRIVIRDDEDDYCYDRDDDDDCDSFEEDEDYDFYNG